MQADRAADDRPDLPVGDQLEQGGVHPSPGLGRERVDAELPVGPRHVQVGQDHAHRGQVGHRELAQRATRQPRLGVVVEADGEVAAAQRAAGPHGLGLLAADRVEDDLRAPVAGLVHDHVEDALGVLVDRPLRAQVAAQLGLLRAARDGDHPGAGGDGELDGRRTDRAGAAADDHGLAGLQAGPLVQGQVADVEGQRERRRLDVGELRRRVEDGAREGLLREAAQRLRADADDALADPLLRALARRLDHSGDVHAERERRLRHHGGDATATPGDVAEVERGRRDRDPHLTGARLGRLDLLDLDRLGRRGMTDHAHG